MAAAEGHRGGTTAVKQTSHRPGGAQAEGGQREQVADHALGEDPRQGRGQATRGSLPDPVSTKSGKDSWAWEMPGATTLRVDLTSESPGSAAGQPPLLLGLARQAGGWGWQPPPAEPGASTTGAQTQGPGTVHGKQKRRSRGIGHGEPEGPLHVGRVPSGGWGPARCGVGTLARSTALSLLQRQGRL